MMTDLMQLIFLGTGAAAPSLSRRLPALILQKETTTLLFDCGEGTQIRLLEAGISPAKIEAIFISHLHGDHVFGLPGLLSSQQLFGRTAPLTIYGPPGLQSFLAAVAAVTKYPVAFPLEVIELDPLRESCFQVEKLQITAAPLEHSIACLGYRVEEAKKPGKFDEKKAIELGIPFGPLRKRLLDGEMVQWEGQLIQPHQVVGASIPGRIITYCTDTRPCPNTISLAHHSDVLIHDATFSDLYADRAAPTYHCTGREAAVLAQQAEVGRLLLWHLSIRLHGEQEAALLAEAKEIFPASYLPNDLETVEIYRRGSGA